MGAYHTTALRNYDNEPVYVDLVPTGKACNCHCQECGAPLIAKNRGTIRAHCFAHEKGKVCLGAVESSIHHLAKQVLDKAGGIMLPEASDSSKPNGFVHLHDIEVEWNDLKHNIKPDVTGILDDGRRLYIEIFYAHKVPGNKINIIVENNLLCIEVDVRYFEVNEDKLYNFLVNKTEDRKWIVKPPVTSEEGFSINYPRDPRFEEATKLLGDAFEQHSLTIDDSDHYYPSYYDKDGVYNEDISRGIFNLYKLGYDVCKTDTKILGFHTDLLLYRSKMENKGYICINFRGRRRNEGAKLPHDLKIIDIIFGCLSKTESLVSGHLRRSNSFHFDEPRIEFLGFWEWKTVDNYINYQY